MCPRCAESDEEHEREKREGGGKKRKKDGGGGGKKGGKGKGKSGWGGGSSEEEEGEEDWMGGGGGRRVSGRGVMKVRPFLSFVLFSFLFCEGELSEGGRDRRADIWYGVGYCSNGTA